MKAAVLHELNDLRLEVTNTPEITPSTILLKVHSCAICGSDLRIIKYGNPRVKYPTIIGHEISGEIVSIGENVEGYAIGDRVALGADIPCGKCYVCTNGKSNCCDQNYAIGYQFQGGFAEYCLLEPVIVNYGPIVKIPSMVSFDEAALMEPLACVLNGFELGEMKVGKSVLIIGAGPIGCMGIMVARTLGASKIIISEIDSKRLEMAKPFEADVFLNSKEENIEETIRKLTNGTGIDLVLVMCPSVEAQEQALELVAKRGYVNFFGGLPQNSRKINLSSNIIHYKECFITGSHGSTPRHNQIAMSLIASGKVQVIKLITHKFNLNQIQEGLETMRNFAGLKVIINPNPSTS